MLSIWCVNNFDFWDPTSSEIDAEIEYTHLMNEEHKNFQEKEMREKVLKNDKSLT